MKVLKKIGLAFVFVLKNRCSKINQTLKWGIDADPASDA
jgi:hypothetical protein